MISHRLAKADPRLADQVPVANHASGFVGATFPGGGTAGNDLQLVVVLNREKPPERFGKAKWWPIARGMFTVVIGKEQFDDLLACPEVEMVYGSHPMRLALDSSKKAMKIPAIRVSAESLGRTGKNIVVGIIDYGFDLTHPDFLNKDGKTTRVAYFWDQTQQGGTTSTFNYGVEFDKKKIDEALRQGPEHAFTILGKPPRDAHGTHVAGIAAGKEGVAPDATLILVNLRQDADNLPKDTYVIQALEYIFSKSKNFEDEPETFFGKAKHFLKTPKRELPCVINLSVSRNDGGHDGYSVVEQAIDLLLAGTAGRAVVVAAGNNANAGLHAEWEYEAGKTTELKWAVPEVLPEQRPASYDLELWYSSRDQITAQVVSPDGEESPEIHVNMDDTRPIGATNVQITSTRFVKPGGDARIFIRLYKPVMSGTWTVRLKALPDSHAGRLHAWIDDTPEEDCRARFEGETASSSTIGSPATSFLGIAVGNIDHHVTPMSVVEASSRGRTRDVREKPEVVAPGVNIRSTCALGGHEECSGTSMSAPHITGIIACLFEQHPGLTAQQIQKVLIAAGDGASYDEAAGYGLVDALKALRLVEYFVMPQ